MKYLDMVKKRHSCRSYDGRPLSETDRKELDARLDRCLANPFGAAVRLAVLDNDAMAGKKLGTYGVIRGAGLYIAGIARRSERDMEGLGFAMERAVLEATDMGLGTCWLAGTYSRADFSSAVPLSADERIVCVSPLGYPAAKPTALDAMMRRVAGSAKRKAWDVLFFDGEAGNPLSAGEAGEYRDALEAVRLAPSASNGQPWRILRRGGAFHFYRAGGEHGRVDMGIAACHFELVAREAGLAGEWESLEPAGPPNDRLLYFTSWVPGH
jgi:nitroreductase